MRIIFLVFILCIGMQPVMAQVYSAKLCESPAKIERKSMFDDCIDYKKAKFNYRDALNIAQEGMRRFPYSYDLRLKKAVLLENLGNTVAAEKEMIGLINLYPDKQELHNYLGRMYYNKDSSKALLALLTSISLNPSSTMSQENLIFVRRLLDGRPRTLNLSDQDSRLSSYKIDDFDQINIILTKLSNQNEITMSELTHRLNTFFAALSQYQHRKEGFFWQFYAPKFIHIYNNQNTAKFAKYISNSQ